MVAAIGLVNYTYKFVVALFMTPFLYLIHNIIDKYLGKELTFKMLTNAAKDEGQFSSFTGIPFFLKVCIPKIVYFDNISMFFSQ